MYKCTCKEIHKMWTYKLYSLKTFANFLLVLVEINYTKMFKNFKRGKKWFLQLFKTQHISAQCYGSFDKKLWQNSNFGFQGYTELQLKQKTKKYLQKPVVIHFSFPFKGEISIIPKYARSFQRNRFFDWSVCQKVEREKVKKVENV